MPSLRCTEMRLEIKKLQEENLKLKEDYEKLQTTIDNKWVEEINSLYITILDLSQEIERLKKLS